jgi:glycosyltransferase involved in cell wall biosynthesis
LEITKINKLEKHVNFIEHIQHDQISDEMYTHDIFIMPSYVETFGRVYFEAMAMGIPIICAKNSGIHGYFKEMEEGISVIHNDIADISNKLEILITNQELRMRIGFQGQKLVEGYTWENITKTLHDIYLKATNQKNGYL